MLEVNIYSHVFGSLLFAALPIYGYRNIFTKYESAGEKDLLVLAAFFYGVSICFLLSAT